MNKRTCKSLTVFFWKFMRIYLWGNLTTQQRMIVTLAQKRRRARIQTQCPYVYRRLCGLIYKAILTCHDNIPYCRDKYLTVSSGGLF